jgi:uncharacterized protein YecE (DUF72 family)
MDFGLLPPNEFPLVDFTLPEDTSLTKKVLAKAVKPAKPAVYIGCAKWGRKEWLGMIYPEKTKEANFLDEYLKHFNAIEVNATFYRIPDKQTVIKWRQKAENSREDFKFSPKFSNPITHIRRLKGAEDQTAAFLDSIYEFGKYLGPCLLQLSDNFGPKNIDVLTEYLQALPADLDVFVEVRHKDWFTDLTARKDLFDMLHDLQRGAVITDTAGRRDCVHMELSVPRAFIRFVGNQLHDTDFKRIDDWAERLNKWINMGLQSIYFYLHQHDETFTPKLAAETVKTFNEKMGLSLELPTFINPTSLFDK